MTLATKKRSKPVRPKHSPGANGDVLTLSEAAEYLRMNEAQLESLLEDSDMPGKRIGNEWRFSRTGLQNWLSSPRHESGMKKVLAMAGQFKDDPFLDEIVREAYRRRGRTSSPEET
jgi:excisionase family DNA binding protein